MTNKENNYFIDPAIFDPNKDYTDLFIGDIKEMKFQISGGHFNIRYCFCKKEKNFYKSSSERTNLIWIQADGYSKYEHLNTTLAKVYSRYWNIKLENSNDLLKYKNPSYSAGIFEYKFSTEENLFNDIYFIPDVFNNKHHSEEDPEIHLYLKDLKYMNTELFYTPLCMIEPTSYGYRSTKSSKLLYCSVNNYDFFS